MSASPTALGAIITTFDGSALKATTAGGLGAYVGKMPDQLSDQSLPFVAVFHDGESPYYDTEAGYQEWTRFHFEVYDTLANVEALALKIKALFDKPATNDANAAFAVLGCFVVRVWRPDGENCYTVQPTIARTSDGKIIFMATIRFRFDLVRIL